MQIAGFIYTAVLLQHIIKKNLISEYFKEYLKQLAINTEAWLYRCLETGLPPNIHTLPPPLPTS